MDIALRTTGSFQNQPPSGVKATRKRGIAALLADSTSSSTAHSCKRACKARAEQRIQALQAKCSPRGNPTAAAAARWRLRQLEKAKAEPSLRDSEWRLDQEATAVHKSEEEKRAILTELGQVSLELDTHVEKCKRKSHPPKFS